MKTKELGIHILNRLAEGAPEFVEVVAHIPDMFGDKEMLVLAMPRSLFELPGNQDVVRKFCTDVSVNFVRSTGAKIASVESRDCTLQASGSVN